MGMDGERDKGAPVQDDAKRQPLDLRVRRGVREVERHTPRGASDDRGNERKTTKRAEMHLDPPEVGPSPLFRAQLSSGSDADVRRIKTGRLCSWFDFGNCSNSDSNCA